MGIQNSLEARIAALGDAEAIELLNRIARGHGPGGGMLPPGAPNPSIPTDEQAADALAASEPKTPDTPLPSDGSAARAALLLLADDPEIGPNIGPLMAGPEPTRLGFDPVTGTLLVGGLLLALQTHFKFERKTDGTWTVKIEKKPTKDGLISPLIKKLMSFFGE